MLRVGLLVCDHLPAEFGSISGDYPALFERLFERHPQLGLVVYDLPVGQFPANPDECDSWIVTGSRHSVYDSPGDGREWIGRLADFVVGIHDSHRRYVGVCFGHQMIAHALGGKVERSERGWGVGIKEVTVPDPPQWLGLGSFRLLNSHQDQVTALPPGAVNLGGNEHCPISAMQMADMVGIQGHPEFTTELSEALILSRRGSVLTDAVADAALESLATPPDNAAIGTALAAFLSS